MVRRNIYNIVLSRIFQSCDDTSSISKFSFDVKLVYRKNPSTSEVTILSGKSFVTWFF